LPLPGEEVRGEGELAAHSRTGSSGGDAGKVQRGRAHSDDAWSLRARVLLCLILRRHEQKAGETIEVRYAAAIDAPAWFGETNPARRLSDPIGAGHRMGEISAHHTK